MSRVTTAQIYQPRLVRFGGTFTLAVWPGLLPEYGVTGEFVGFRNSDGVTFRPILAIEQQAAGADIYSDLTASDMKQAGIEVIDIWNFALTDQG
jgi:hypothetical protein